MSYNSSGSGVVTSITESISSLAAFQLADASYSIEQKVKTTVTVTHGVALPASPQESTSDLSDQVIVLNVLRPIVTSSSISYDSQEYAYTVPKCKGTKTDVNYRQIGDSNLYDLEITTTQMWIRISGPNYNNSWMQ